MLMAASWLPHVCTVHSALADVKSSVQRAVSKVSLSDHASGSVQYACE